LQRDRDAIRGDLERQRQQSILLTCSDIRSEFSLYSRLIAVSAVIFGIALVFDQFKDLTKISTTLRLVIGIPVAAFVLYAALALFWPSIDPASIRRRALRATATQGVRG
jgi:phage shock protein PspC (stress-responsive transcriptional regulator)